MTTKIYLTVVEDANDGRDSIIQWDGDIDKPMIAGNEPDESLACGSCKRVIAKHISTRTLYERFATDNRLLLKCGCGAYNLAPSSKVID